MLLISLFVICLVPNVAFEIQENHDFTMLSSSRVFVNTTDILIVERSGIYNSIHNNKEKVNQLCFFKLCIEDTVNSKPLIEIEKFDNRKSIMQSIPGYFHGSKYRSNFFVI